MRLLAIALLFASMAPQGHVTAVPKEAVEWKAAPGLVGGMMTAIAWGDPDKGAYQALIKVPAGVLVKPHFHKIDEFATVVSGSVIFGQGDVIDESKGVEVAAGGYITIPGGTAHWAKCTQDAVIVRFAPGPRDLTYLKDGDKAPGNAQPMKIVQAKD